MKKLFSWISSTQAKKNAILLQTIEEYDADTDEFSLTVAKDIYLKRLRATHAGLLTEDEWNRLHTLDLGEAQEKSWADKIRKREPGKLSPPAPLTGTTYLKMPDKEEPPKNKKGLFDDEIEQAIYHSAKKELEEWITLVYGKCTTTDKQNQLRDAMNRIKNGAIEYLKKETENE